MNERDEVRLRDMLDAARKAQAFAQDKTRADLDSDEILAFALVRVLEIVGEAANNIGQKTRASLPQIPWKAIIGMRHRIVHDYVNVNLNVVWDTLVDDIPPLIAELERILPPEEGQQEENQA